MLLVVSRFPCNVVVHVDSVMGCLVVERSMVIRRESIA